MRSIWSGGGRTRKGVYVSCLIKVRRINYTYLENTGKEKKKTVVYLSTKMTSLHSRILAVTMLPDSY
jgi:hypothetical protein